MSDRGVSPLSWVAVVLCIACLGVSTYMWRALWARIDRLASEVESRVYSRILREACKGTESFYRDMGLPFDCGEVRSFEDLVKPFFRD